MMAMAFMLCDHVFFTLCQDQIWMNCIGRLAFPIFAFLASEGYYHTHSFKDYMRRLLVTAVLSEIPFNLMVSGRIFFPQYQNVLWTFIIALLLVHADDLGRSTRYRLPVRIGVFILAYLSGRYLSTDYGYIGIYTVMAFCYFRGNSPECRLAQLSAMLLLHIPLAMNPGILEILSGKLVISRQAFAVFALIPLWLYDGRQGLHGMHFQKFCYGFYPVHMAVLSMIRFWSI